jgi:hypothetical protein
MSVLVKDRGGTTYRRVSQHAENATSASENTSVGKFFSVLNSVRVSVDALPFARHGMPPSRSDPLLSQASEREARRLPLRTPAAWLVPAADERLCLLYTVDALTLGPGGRSLPPAVVQQCATVAAATAGRLVVTQSLSASSRGGSEEVRILGIVPDGVARVSVTGGDGRSTVLPILRNSYAGTVADPVAVRFSDRVGTSSVSRVVPVASVDSRAAMPTP